MRHLVFVMCAVALLAGGCSGSRDDPLDTSAPTAATTGMPRPEPTTTGPPAPTTTDPAPTTTPAPAAAFDFESLGTFVTTAATPLGTLAWRRSGSVPKQWIDDGFPHPEPGVLAAGHPLRRGRDYDAAIAAAPCCLTFLAVDEGLVGLGATEWDDGRDAPFPRNWAQAGGLGLTCEESPWRGYADELWFTADGAMWTRLADDAFGTEGLGLCGELTRVAHHEERWVVIGQRPRSGPHEPPEPVAVTSTDLAHWETLDIDFGGDGVRTEIWSLTASADGWAMFGTRVSAEPSARSETGIPLGPHTLEWVAWASVDGVAFDPLDFTAVAGPPWCEPPEPHSCAAIYAYLVDEALVAYVHQYGAFGGDRDISGWELWVGVLEP